MNEAEHALADGAVLELPRLMVATTGLPGDPNVGGLILGDLLAEYPKDKLQVVHLPSASANEKQSSVDAVRLPDWPETTLNNKWASLRSHFHFRTTFAPACDRAAGEILKRLAQSPAEKIWFILDTPASILVAAKVSEKLKVPLLTLVWDAPEYLLTKACFDRLSSRAVMDAFGSALKKSLQIAVVSDAMKNRYQQDYGRPVVILRHGLPAEVCRPAAERLHAEDEVLIGYAGGLYAMSAWYAFLQALDETGWKIGGRRVRLRLLGESFPVRSRSTAHIEYLGYRNSLETADLLAECDLNYLPQPFGGRLRELSEYSFPTKLSSYAAAGRPVIVHAPPHASLTAFCGKNRMGVVVNSLDPGAIVAAIASILGEEAYRSASSVAAELAVGELGAEQFHSVFRNFVSGIAPCER